MASRERESREDEAKWEDENEEEDFIERGIPEGKSKRLM